MATLKIKIGNNTAWDLETQYSGKIVLLDMPDNIPLKPKNIYSHSWLDENGDDEYLPSTMYYEPAIIAMKFGAKVDNSSATGTLRATVKQFLDAMNEMGFVIDQKGKYPKIKQIGNERFVRFKSLGAG